VKDIYRTTVPLVLLFILVLRIFIPEDRAEPLRFVAFHRH
jgi:hypothetical protein